MALVEVLVMEKWLAADAPAWETSGDPEAAILGLGEGCDCVKPVAPPRGLPAQYSAEVAAVFGTGSVDRSHLLLSELLDAELSPVLAAYAVDLGNWAGTRGYRFHEVRVVFGVVS